MIKEINNMFQVIVRGAKDNPAVEWFEVEQDSFGRPKVSQEVYDWCEENQYNPPLKFRFGEYIPDPKVQWTAPPEYEYYFTFLDYNSAMHFNLRWS